MSQREARFIEILQREDTPQLLEDSDEACPFVRQPSRQRAAADGQGFRDRGGFGLAIWQQPLNFLLDRGAEAAARDAIGARRFLADRPQELQEVGIGGDKREADRLVRERQTVDRRIELDRAAIEALDLPTVRIAAARASDTDRPGVPACDLATGLERQSHPELGVLLHALL